MGGNNKTLNRRKLKFQTMDDLLTDARHLADTGVQANGGWTASQVVSHVATGIKCSAEGFGITFPFPMRVFGRLIRGRMLKKGMPTGIKITGKARKLFIPPTDITFDEAMAQLTGAIESAKQNGMTARSPIFGQLSQEQWVQFHCRHAELHFSFLTPATQSNETAQPDNGTRHASSPA